MGKVYDKQEIPNVGFFEWVYIFEITIVAIHMCATYKELISQRFNKNCQKA